MSVSPDLVADPAPVESSGLRRVDSTAGAEMAVAAGDSGAAPVGLGSGVAPAAGRALVRGAAIVAANEKIPMKKPLIAM